MLHKDNRLTKVRDFNLLMKHGRWINGQLFNIKVLELAKFVSYFPKKEDPDNFKKQLRIAVNVSIKVSKSAVKRNRVKRQTSEVIRLLLKANTIKSGYYLLVNAKNEALEKNYAEISEEIQLLFKKAGVI
ncbi:MAG TPA: ribonuclease P protein component [Patescibacteria group bacterium]|nr:ribonuclease P protein component [Patescibacteria group bacterium]